MQKYYSSLHQWAQDIDNVLRSLVNKKQGMENNTAIAIEARVIKQIFDTVETEYLRAKFNHSEPFKNAHEGYAVLLEEVDELWDEIKHGQDKEMMCAEAIQIAAMAIRFIRELTIFEASMKISTDASVWKKLAEMRGAVMTDEQKAYHQNLKDNPNR